MWYPLTEIVFQAGSSASQYAKRSVTSLIEGSGG